MIYRPAALFGLNVGDERFSDGDDIQKLIDYRPDSASSIVEMQRFVERIVLARSQTSMWLDGMTEDERDSRGMQLLSELDDLRDDVQGEIDSSIEPSAKRAKAEVNDGGRDTRWDRSWDWKKVGDS